MSGEQTAETLANDTTATTEIPVNDGFIDLDAQPEPADENPDDEGQEEQPEAKKPEGEEETKKKLSGAQRAKLREQRLLNELSARDRELEELRRAQPAAKTAGAAEDKPPREEDFNGDFFAFQTAKTAYEAGKAAAEAVEKRLGAREQSEREAKQIEIARERDVAHMERVEDAREVIADFDQVMKGMDGVQVRQDVIDEIKSSENSALLAYHLAKNPDKLNALNSMSGRELAREMGRLEATVKMPEAKKATTAPAPLSRQRGGAAPRSQDADLAAYLKRTYG
jgi:hypothetical protein